MKNIIKGTHGVAALAGAAIGFNRDAAGSVTIAAPQVSLDADFWIGFAALSGIVLTLIVLTMVVGFLIGAVRDKGWTVMSAVDTDAGDTPAGAVKVPARGVARQMRAHETPADETPDYTTAA